MNASRRRFVGGALASAAIGAMGLHRVSWGQDQPEPREAPPDQAREFKLGKVIYENPLSSEKDVEGFRMEGEAKVTFPNGRMRLNSVVDPSLKQAANYVYWCPEHFPDNVAISWDFTPLKETGLCIVFFSATGRNGEDVLDEKLAKRSGNYRQYHHGDINALHASYYRRNAPKTVMQMNLCNLRKSYGFHLVAQGADPMPKFPEASAGYRIQVVKIGPTVWFSVQDVLSFKWVDDGKKYGPVLGGGKIAFRQMAPMVGEYAKLMVHKAELA